MISFPDRRSPAGDNAEGQNLAAGNLYDKYGSRNPVVRFLMKGFFDSLSTLTAMSGASDIHEVGCGEGNLSLLLAGGNRRVRGSDNSPLIVGLAQRKATAKQAAVQFKTASIYELVPEEDRAELVVCCEVLEHLESPDKALSILADLSNPYFLASVPREPLWGLLNLARGKYVARLGNTPGHLHRWSSTAFLRLLSPYFQVIAVRYPIPWTMVLCTSRKTLYEKPSIK